MLPSLFKGTCKRENPRILPLAAARNLRSCSKSIRGARQSQAPGREGAGWERVGRPRSELLLDKRRDITHQSITLEKFMALSFSLFQESWWLSAVTGDRYEEVTVEQ